MKEYRFRSDLVRAVVNGFALPLGFEPGKQIAPSEGYTIAYNSGEGDDPDTYTYQISVSHDQLAPVCRKCFELLPEEIYAIIEIGSRDAYRSVDVYLGEEAISSDEFRTIWKHYESFLLEDGSIAAGANAEEPFIEIFIDQRKTVIIHVPLSMRDEVDAMLHSFGLEELIQTWPDFEEDDPQAPMVRPVLDVSDAQFPDIDELLLQLRHSWRLQLNLDPDCNTDEAGRALGLTLWHAVVIAFKTGDDTGAGAYITFWLTAGSLTQTEEFIQEELERHPEWTFADFYTIDRVAFDERPEDMGDLAPRRSEAEIHVVTIEPWQPSEPDAPTAGAGNQDPGPDA